MSTGIECCAIATKERTMVWRAIDKSTPRHSIKELKNERFGIDPTDAIRGTQG
ncbi:MAG: hypothetical protein JGK17_28205 [Microcoleus sp. PH2017_10_PVI_O_A]|uniref:hypothetical protein n=1 Tax=unclassified Microcoleus TaxID=2642155 RepID=UPI001DCCC88E|nr:MULTISPECIES: hypothetical protein [unclassified Microcoleus]MCC3409372.1 hypothetical protein [Microcoleus sp. PH2017_10_PVI_O_A]MCC3463615.1 hypothetical protein [Microcoleus sp. PH2017_11_PCY_U_A]MCC3481958.1 hypothetical protein [Microcoleus sp. PH2017_12_PCY_D_A]MCC3532475.1 hypothetical protein [Microcoleus sp. PH2017_21_RUC_O_A]MCC3544747.1 hypothetical protein [Microcoleus sp. PH2017_22_RUC_O_B]